MHDLIAKPIAEGVALMLSDSFTHLTDKVTAMGQCLDGMVSVESMSGPALPDQPPATVAFPPVLPKNASNFDVHEQKKSTPPLEVSHAKKNEKHGENRNEATKRPNRNKSASMSSERTDMASGSSDQQSHVVGGPRRARVPAGLLRGTAASSSAGLQASEKQRSFHIYYLKHVASITGTANLKVSRLAVLMLLLRFAFLRLLLNTY
jgi:hypothetical protein